MLGLEGASAYPTLAETSPDFLQPDPLRASECKGFLHLRRWVFASGLDGSAWANISEQRILQEVIDGTGSIRDIFHCALITYCCGLLSTLQKRIAGYS